MNTDVKISVITTVYNRADKIHRVFDSLEKSTYRNFELILMDDGSTDNIEEVVNQYIEKVDFPVTFLRQENRGKHTAVNILHQMAKGEFAFQLDSDDEIVPDAMEKALKAWDSIAPEKKKDYWCVAGRTIDQRKREMLGEPFPEGINDLEWEVARKLGRKVPGEKSSFWRTDVLKTFRYPEPKGVKFVAERLMWHSVENNYKNYFVDDIFLVYYINDGDCLTSPPKNIQWAKNTYFNYLYILNRCRTYEVTVKEYWRNIVRICAFRFLIPQQDRGELEKPDFKNKLVLTLVTPLVLICLPLIKKKFGWTGN